MHRLALARRRRLKPLGRWQHPQSVERYTKVDVEGVRAGLNKVGKRG